MTASLLFPAMLRTRANQPDLADHVAIAAGSDQMSYPDLMDAADRCAGNLAGLGIRKGERIAFLQDRVRRQRGAIKSLVVPDRALHGAQPVHAAGPARPYARM